MKNGIGSSKPVAGRDVRGRFESYTPPPLLNFLKINYPTGDVFFSFSTPIFNLGHKNRERSMALSVCGGSKSPE